MGDLHAHALHFLQHCCWRRGACDLALDADQALFAFFGCGRKRGVNHWCTAVMADTMLTQLVAGLLGQHAHQH